MANWSVYKMTESTTVRFVEMYRSEECLWNTRHLEYKNKDARNQAAERISERLNIYGFGPPEVLHKFKNIRSSYCQELKKINSSIRNGSGEVYKPKVAWFPIMDNFLKPHIQMHNQLVPDENTLGEMIEINEDELVKVKPSTYHFENTNSNTNGESNTTSKPTNKPQNKNTHSNGYPDNVKKMRIMDNPEYVQTTKTTDENNPDEFDAFGRFIATQLRELPIEYAIKAECKILQCLADERITYFKEYAEEKEDE